MDIERVRHLLRDGDINTDAPAFASTQPLSATTDATTKRGGSKHSMHSKHNRRVRTEPMPSGTFASSSLSSARNTTTTTADDNADDDDGTPSYRETNRLGMLRSLSAKSWKDMKAEQKVYLSWKRPRPRRRPSPDRAHGERAAGAHTRRPRKPEPSSLSASLSASASAATSPPPPPATNSPTAMLFSPASSPTASEMAAAQSPVASLDADAAFNAAEERRERLQGRPLWSANNMMESGDMDMVVNSINKLSVPGAGHPSFALVEDAAPHPSMHALTGMSFIEQAILHSCAPGPGAHDGAGRPPPIAGGGFNNTNRRTFVDEEVRWTRT